ncbi:hypothetical protein [Paenibacillus flagellatus]|uniref:Uncharacterized protein n=1 Tax=Paenibacillus flagellatus TaxID=2211139 RepID=A0A2V5K6Y8_9BACL|nr:hypothetical protein [Paenibacillus flagellatus]PYI55205.1 hypothetical protein DLM86_11825 [Paenibacillus flagellatus]
MTSLRAFLNAAELVWFTVIDSERVGPIIVRGGIDYQALPPRFDSVAKIRRLFRRYWGVRFTNILICNLRLLRINGRLYAPVGDPPELPTTVVALRIVKRSGDSILVRAALTGLGEGRTTIFYTIRFDPKTGAARIVNRTGRRNDIRYQRCVRSCSR